MWSSSSSCCCFIMQINFTIKLINTGLFMQTHICYVCVCVHAYFFQLLRVCSSILKKPNIMSACGSGMTNLLSLSTATQLSTTWPWPCFPASLTRRQAVCLLNYPRSPNGVLIFKGNGCMALRTLSWELLFLCLCGSLGWTWLAGCRGRQMEAAG